MFVKTQLIVEEILISCNGVSVIVEIHSIRLDVRLMMEVSR